MSRGRNPTGKALGIKPGEVLTAEHTGGSWVVRRGNGRANPAVEQAVVNSLSYSPDLDRYIPVGPITNTGAVIRVRQ
jgi:hypothetical protein